MEILLILRAFRGFPEKYKIVSYFLKYEMGTFLGCLVHLFIVHRFHPLLNCLTISGNFICLPWYVLNITEYLIFSIPLCTNGSPTCTNGSILCCVPILLMIKLYLKNNLRKWKLCYILIQCGNILLIS